MADIPQNEPYFLPKGTKFRTIRNAWRTISPVVAPRILPNKFKTTARALALGGTIDGVASAAEHMSGVYDTVKNKDLAELTDETAALLQGATGNVTESDRLSIFKKLKDSKANTRLNQQRDAFIKKFQSLPLSEQAKYVTEYGSHILPYLAEQYVDSPWTWRKALRTANPATYVYPKLISMLPHKSPKELVEDVYSKVTGNGNGLGQMGTFFESALKGMHDLGKHGSRYKGTQQLQESMEQLGLPSTGKQIEHWINSQ